jgi:hypothetical protein
MISFFFHLSQHLAENMALNMVTVFAAQFLLCLQRVPLKGHAN